jgi:hypothetical protein
MNGLVYQNKRELGLPAFCGFDGPPKGLEAKNTLCRGARLFQTTACLFYASTAPAASNTVSQTISTTNRPDWGRVLDSHIENGELVIKLGPVLILGVAFAGLGALVWKLWLRQKILPNFEVVEAELEIGKLGKIKIQPNYENIQIAHQAWVELTTRKAAVPFDDDYDVIAEVYESYFQLFGRLRDLTKAIPAQKLRKCRDTRKLVDVMVTVLNQGLRPHLTRWQARFKRWYEDALASESNRGKSPQEIQRQFPEYPTLVADLKTLQTNIVRYAEFLREISQGKEE